MSGLLDHAITVGDVLLFAGGWLTLAALRVWRHSIVVRHSDDGGAKGRRLRAEQARGAR